jgi:hypothetical protein
MNEMLWNIVGVLLIVWFLMDLAWWVWDSENPKNDKN